MAGELAIARNVVHTQLKDMMNPLCAKWILPCTLHAHSYIRTYIYDPSLCMTKDKIRDRDSDFLVTAYSWPAFMYKDYSFDLANIKKGLFHSTLLLRVFKHLFASPPSTKEIDVLRVNHSHVANIIGMKTVTPCAIAYTACQLHFALSNINSWQSVDGDFDYYNFYNNIVDFFEVVPGTDAQAHINKLLKW
ncbi:hypothetical protein EDB19DRAFT_1910556 [Suillus lakei]|nr:hypothetical protein EDB19DRAFT_1910556 [Suillus lakei]